MIWLVGANGMLGTQLAGLLADEGIPFKGTDRDVSILDAEAIRDFGREFTISWIINCAAYTNVDGAEKEPDVAFAVNQAGAKNLAEFASQSGAWLIHISTDYVYNAPVTMEASIREDAPVDPQSVYGKSKLAGDLEIQRILAEHYILRTSWLYGHYGKNFVSTMLKLMNEKGELRIVADQFGTPTWTVDLAQAIIRIIRQQPAYGIYHYSNEGKTTWYDFACEIQRLGVRHGLLQKEIVLKGISTPEYPTPAKRPAYSYMDKKKIKNALNMEIPAWEQSLADYLFFLARSSRV